MPDGASTGSAEGDLAVRLIEAINAHDGTELSSLLDERSEVVTGRGIHVGPEAIVAWSAKVYDHLRRRYRIDDWRRGTDSVLALGAVQYVWSEGGAVADSSPIALELTFVGGRLRTARVHDDVAAAVAAFDG